MNKELMKKIVTDIKKENIIISTNKPIMLQHNKLIFNKYKQLYPNIFKSSEILYIFKHNNVDSLLNNMFCYCGKKKQYTTIINLPYRKYCCQKCCKKSKEYQTNRYNSWSITWNNHTKEEKEEIHKRQQENRKMTKESINKMLEHRRETISLWTEEFKKQVRKKLSKSKEEMWNKRTGEEKKEIGNKISQGLNKLCNNGLTKAQNKQIKASITYKKKTGYDNPSKNPEVRKKISDINKLNANNRLKLARNTMNILYNSWYSSTQKHRDLWKSKSFKDNYLYKQYKTKKKNNTFYTSQPENINYLKLKQKFLDVIHHYSTDKRYPFECDFYIPSLDLFIECHYHWTHGDPKYNCHEPFNKYSLKHKEMLYRWKNKNTKYYNNAIKTWTFYDPLKLEVFKKNNLNYKIFYTEKEFDKWFDNL